MLTGGGVTTVIVRPGDDAIASSAASRASGTRSTGASCERLGLVEAGQLEQVLDEAAHPDGLLLDALHGLGHFLRRLQGAHPVQLGVAAHRDERGAQLVAGIADEAAHLVDGARAVLERAVDAVEHGVERAVEAADLGVGGRAAEPLAEVAVGDGGGGALHLAQRREGAGDQQPGEQGAQDDDADAEAEEDREVGREGLLGLGQRDGDERDAERAVWPAVERDGNRDGVEGRVMRPCRADRGRGRRA